MKPAHLTEWTGEGGLKGPGWSRYCGRHLRFRGPVIVAGRVLWSYVPATLARASGGIFRLGPSYRD